MSKGSDTDVIITWVQGYYLLTLRPGLVQIIYISCNNEIFYWSVVPGTQESLILQQLFPETTLVTFTP